jgi:hypothetical protein
MSAFNRPSKENPTMTDRDVRASMKATQVLSIAILILLLIGTAAPTSALRIGGPEVVVPVIAHNPGLLGTEWRTDVWIDNPYGDVSDVTLTFYPTNGSPVVVETAIGEYMGLFFDDIVLNTFGLDDIKGMLIVSAPDTRIEVRARIFNTGGGDGEFGQALFGLDTGDLRRQSYVSGVSTIEGNRVSFGIANPTGSSFEVNLYVDDAQDNVNLHFETVTLEPHQLIQFSDVAARWGLPGSSTIRIQVSSALNENLVYAYASVVRNDTGDASFLFGTSPNT